MLIAQLSDVHVGGSRYREDLLRTAIGEINAEKPDLVVVAGDHDARNVGYLGFEDTFGTRDTRLRLQADGLDVALVAVDSSKPDLDEGEIGREHYGWIEEGFAGEPDLRLF